MNTLSFKEDHFSQVPALQMLQNIAVFLWVSRENLLYKDDGIKRISDNALVALTLMIAESNPNDKDIMIKVIVNLLTEKKHN